MRATVESTSTAGAPGGAVRPAWSLRRRAAMAVGLAALTAVVFRSVVGLPFIGFDDPEYLTQNPFIRGGLTAHGLRWALTAGYAANWHPVTWLSHMLDLSVFGLAPAGHHAVNLLLHCASAGMLFLLFERMTSAPWRSALLAALFALHPLRVESVAWVSERKDVLSGLFWIATTLSYVAWVRSPGRRRYAATVALLVLGLASKPMVVTLPFALLLLDAWPLRRIDLARPTLRQAWPLVREKLPLMALSLAASIATLLAQGGAGATRPMVGSSLPDRVANAAASVLGYVAKTFWPGSLAIFYPFPEAHASPLRLAGLVAAVAAATVVAWGARKRFPSLTVGWLWFLGTLVPVLGLVQVGNQAMADRYTYVPAIGLAMALVWAIPSPTSRAWAAAGAAAAAVAVVALGATTVRQIGYWASERRLFEHALEVTGRNWLAETVIGMDLERRGDAAGAVFRYRRALAIQPRAPETLNNLGNLLVSMGRAAEGMAHLREAVRLWPGYVSALSNLGAALCESGRLQEGIAYLQDATRRAPGYVPARYNLAVALAESGRQGEALSQFEQLLALTPDDPQVRAQVERLRRLRDR